MYCNQCGDDVTELGILGALQWYRCRACGFECADELQVEDKKCDLCHTPCEALFPLDNTFELCTYNVCDNCLIDIEADAPPDYTGIPLY